ncbi:hypothetical protein [Streptomyces sp. CBMA29]|nr:hypothetical protein [Streptomyces sp. CBMA29]
MDAKDRGGSYEVTLWRKDGTMPLRITEAVLPTIQGWAAQA